MLKVLKLGYPKVAPKKKKLIVLKRETPGLINLLKHNASELDKKEQQASKAKFEKENLNLFDLRKRYEAKEKEAREMDERLQKAKKI